MSRAGSTQALAVPAHLPPAPLAGCHHDFVYSRGGWDVFLRAAPTIRVKEAKEFKLNGCADLHDVNIILYGRDTSRFDQIYGDDFTFGPQSGNVTARAKCKPIYRPILPAAYPIRTLRRSLRILIHLRTTDLVLNRGSGDASRRPCQRLGG